ncbi:hypothetical protein LPJ57_011445, partial [Coemansia sp. RSA 486]
SEQASVQQPGRKATTESLDNVLEYYRTQPDVLERHSEWEHSNDESSSPNASHTPAAESVDQAPVPVAVAVSVAIVSGTSAAFDNANTAADSSEAFDHMPYHVRQQGYRPELGSSRYPVRESQISPSYQRTSFSSPVVKPDGPILRKNPAGIAAASLSSTKSVSGSLVGLDTDEGAYYGIEEQQRPDDSSVLGTHSHLHSLETTPTIDPARPHAHESASSSLDSDASAPGDQMYEDDSVPARSWNINESNTYQDIYTALDDLPEPDDLMLPPTTVQRSPHHSRYNPSAELVVDDED